MIAGVIKSPGRYSPYLEKAAAKAEARHRARADAGRGLHHAGSVRGRRRQARSRPSDSRAHRRARPYFVEWVKAELERPLSARTSCTAVASSSRRRSTSTAQKAAEKAISSTLNRKGDPSAALVAIKPGTGEVVAMVGGRDFKTQQFNAAVQGNGRQPGSSFKPFVLATALSDGVSPEQTFKSGAAKLAVGNQVWRVTGAHGGQGGADATADRDRAVGELRLRAPHPEGHAREGRRDGREDGPALGHHPGSGHRARGSRRRRHAAGDGGRVRDARRGRQARRAVRHQRGPGREGRRGLLGEGQVDRTPSTRPWPT